MKKIGALVAIVLLSLSAVACTSKEDTKGDSSLNKETVQVSLTSKGASEDVENRNYNFENYIKLIGLEKEKLITTIGEEPETIDEAGLEFAKAGIRVWFKDYGTGPVQQVFINKKDVDFKGVRVGDKIESFKNIFGKPVKEDISSAYSNFEYNGIVLSVYYDPKTEATFAVYILDKDVK